MEDMLRLMMPRSVALIGNLDGILNYKNFFHRYSPYPKILSELFAIEEVKILVKKISMEKLNDFEFTFDGFINLTDILISDCIIDTVNFSNLPKLETLKVITSKITRLNIESLENLKELDIVATGVLKLELDLKKLETLRIINCPLNEVIFKNCNSLMNVTISSCCLHTVPKTLPKSILYLSVDDNFIKFLEMEDFVDLTYLQITNNEMRNYKLINCPKAQVVSFGNLCDPMKTETIRSPFLIMSGNISHEINITFRRGIAEMYEFSENITLIA